MGHAGCRVIEGEYKEVMSPRSHQRLILAAGALGVLFSAACSGGGTSDVPYAKAQSTLNQPPVVIAAKLLDAPLSSAVPVSVQIQAEDPEREAVTYQYQWYVNEAPVAGQTNPTLPSEGLRRGQRVSVEIVPADSVQKGQAYRTAGVLVGNTPPTVSAAVLQLADNGARVEAQAEVSDPDHDRIDLTYRWLQENKVIKEGEEASLSTKGLNPRVPVVVEIVARDPEAAGKPLRSTPLLLSNHPPQIVSTPPAPSGAGGYEYLVKAVDEDGDQIAFQLEQSPAGMTIDEATGRLSWAVSADQVGAVHVKVLAKDGQGSSAYQEFDLVFSRETVPAKPAGV
ncbi:MAG: putative Ig domain-containing protein [Nitrospira sp.]